MDMLKDDFFVYSITLPEDLDMLRNNLHTRLYFLY